MELPLAPLLLEPLLGDVVALPLVLPLAPELELDLLKCASHSEREICPSLFVSTDEKLGVEALELELPRPLDPLLLVPPDAALPPEDDGEEELDEPLLGELDEPLDAPPEVDGDDDDDDPLLMPLVLLPLLPPDDELCAAARFDSANSAAAVAMLTNFRFNIG